MDLTTLEALQRLALGVDDQTQRPDLTRRATLQGLAQAFVAACAIKPCGVSFRQRPSVTLPDFTLARSIMTIEDMHLALHGIADKLAPLADHTLNAAQNAILAGRIEQALDQALPVSVRLVVEMNVDDITRRAWLIAIDLEDPGALRIMSGRTFPATGPPVQAERGRIELA